MPASASMPIPEGEHPVLKRRRWRAFLWLIGILLLTLSVVPISWLVIRWRTQREIDAELARIRAAGEPASFEDVINSIPPLAAEKDCTQMYDEVFAVITTQLFERQSSELPYVGDGEADETLIPPPGIEWPGLAAAAEFIDAQNYNFVTLDKAAELGGECRFPMKVEELAQSSFKRIGTKSRAAARLLQLRAVVAAHRNDVDEVHRALISLRELADCLDAEPNTISLLLRIAIMETYSNECEQMLDEVQFTEEQVESIHERLMHVEYAAQLHTALLSERLYLAQAFAGAYYEVDALAELRSKRSWLWHLTSHVDAREFWHMMRRHCDAASTVDVAKARDQMLDNLDRVDELIGKPRMFDQRYLVTGSTAGQAPKIASIVMRAVAINRTTMAFVACYRHQLQHGEFPESLDELVPMYVLAVPTDPYSSEPIRYVRSAGEVVVYSIGEDGIDAGGVLQQEQPNVDDIGFRSHAWKRTYDEAQARRRGESPSVEESPPSVPAVAEPAE